MAGPVSRRSAFLASLVSFAALAGLLPAAIGKPLPRLLTDEKGPVGRAPGRAASPDTLWFGGESPTTGLAMPNNIWDFEDGTAQGWTSIDLTEEGARFRHVTAESAAAHGDVYDPTITAASSAGSMWCGLHQDEALARCWPGGQGYGNHWHQRLEKSFDYDGTDSISIAFDYYTDVELAFGTEVYDQVFLELIDTLGGVTELASYDGTNGAPSAPLAFSTIVPPSAIGPAGQFTLRFTFESDYAYSDGDEYLDTEGAVGLDNIAVNGSGISDLSDFEPGPDPTNGWTATAPSVGSLFDIAHLDDVEPTPADSCPVSAFVAVASVTDSSSSPHPEGQAERLMSNTVALAGAPCDSVYGLVIRYDLYADITTDDGVVGYRRGVFFYPSTCPQTGAVGWSPESEAWWTFYVYHPNPSCWTATLAVDSTLAQADSVRFVIDVVTIRPDSANHSPYFDNLRVGLLCDLAPPWWDVAVTELADSARSTGVSWPDFDGDGDEDLFVSTFSNLSATDGPSRLFENVAGTLVEMTPPELDDERPFRGATWADHDNDGDLDLFHADAGSAPGRLYRNDSGTFTDITAALPDSAGASEIGLWVDTDVDGLVDLYVVRSGVANQLYRNLGNGSFALATPAVLADTSGSSAAAWSDVDADGDADVYLSLAGVPNRLLRNDGGNSFADVTAPPLDDAGSSTGVSWGDADGDGLPELFLAQSGGQSRIFQNLGDGSFSLLATIVAPSNATMGSWSDTDLDGDLDLHVVGGPGEANRLYRNDGGAFVDATQIHLDDTGWTTSTAFADVDGDGDPDDYVANRDGVNALYRNDGTPAGHRWLAVGLQGTLSNRSAIGARVTAVTGGARQHRELTGGSGLWSQEPLLASFGLGATAVVDSVIVAWPSGIEDALVAVAADQRITIVEGVTVVDAGKPLREVPDLRLFAAVPNPFRRTTEISFAVPTEGAVSLRVYDVTGRLVRTLVSGHTSPGRHAVSWDRRDGTGWFVPAGVYFYELRSDAGRRSRKLVVLR